MKFALFGRIRNFISDTLRHIDFQKLIFCILVVIVFYGILSRANFTTDTYAVIESDKNSIALNFLMAGRFITYLFFTIFSALKLPFLVCYRISYVFAVAFLVMAIYLLDNIFKKLGVKNNITSFLLSTITLINPFTLELFLYLEKGVMVGSLLFIILATGYFLDFIVKKNKKHLLLSAAMALIATCCYQGTFGLFLVLCTLIVLIKSKSFVDFLKNSIASVALYAQAPIVNLLLTKIVLHGGGKIKGSIVLSESINKIWLTQKNMFWFFDIIPKWSILIGLALIVAVLLMSFLNNKKNYKRLFFLFTRIFYLSLVVVFAAVAPQMLQNTENIWLVARSTFCFASIFGMILALLVLEYKNSAKFANIIALYFMAIFLFRTNTILIDNYIVSSLDQRRAQAISATIEKTQGIKYIATLRPNTERPSYDFVFRTGDINASAAETSWSDDESINYYNGTDYISGELPDIKIQARCIDDMKKEPGIDKVYIEGDTAIVCLY